MAPSRYKSYFNDADKELQKEMASSSQGSYMILIRNCTGNGPSSNKPYFNNVDKEL